MAGATVVRNEERLKLEEEMEKMKERVERVEKENKNVFEKGKYK